MVIQVWQDYKMTDEEQKAHQDDGIWFMYDDEAKIDDMFWAIVVSFVAVIVLVGLFAWEVYLL